MDIYQNTALDVSLNKIGASTYGHTLTSKRVTIFGFVILIEQGVVSYTHKHKKKKQCSVQ